MRRGGPYSNISPAYSNMAATSSLHSMLRNKQALLDIDHVTQQRLYGIIYGYFNKCHAFHYAADSGIYPYESVFNVEFSPTGHVVAAAHANKAITIHDHRPGTLVASIPKAHTSCANVITFLDDHLFASGSDDTTIRLWDLRQCTKGPLGILKGHKGWVKNIEFDRKSNMLFTLGFDDGVRYWDMHDLDVYQSNQWDGYNLVLDLKDAVRMRLSSDSSLMAISIRKNHLYIVSHFDGRTIGSLWDAFPVNLSYNYNNSAWNNLSTHCKNNQNNIPYVKKICGFKDEDYRTPLSLAFHPEGRLLAMRFVDVKERSLMQEMSVLYDVSTQERPKHYYSCQESEKCFLKYCNERSPDDAIDYIKEISFSEDGRILASPYGNTVRLFAVDTTLTPMDCFYDQRFRSYEKTLKCIDFELVAQCSGHSSPVLTCRFNSRYMCLASGCLKGKIVFNCPKI